jgi:hypothetical protein
MGDKSIKKEVKKMKKSGTAPASSVSMKPIAPQPALITKKKKPL